MNIDSIESGVVIDHIQPGKGMELVELLKLDTITSPVAVIRNARSQKSGAKDIIKIEGQIDLDLDAIGFIDPHITVNIIVDGKIERKENLALPDKVVNVVVCKNPRCITTTEGELDQVFKLSELDNKYRCVYCEQEYEKEHD